MKLIRLSLIDKLINFIKLFIHLILGAAEREKMGAEIFEKRTSTTQNNLVSTGITRKHREAFPQYRHYPGMDNIECELNHKKKLCTTAVTCQIETYRKNRRHPKLCK